MESATISFTLDEARPKCSCTAPEKFESLASITELKSLFDRMPLFAYYLIACLIFSACSASGPDQRDLVVGNYSGIQVATYWDGSTPCWHMDTAQVKLYVLKARRDSVISLYLDSIVPGTEFSFSYVDQICTPINNPRNPKLVFDSDSLYFYYKAGLGPALLECFGVKD